MSMVIDMKIFPLRLLISDIDNKMLEDIPAGCYRTYRVPATCAVLYCRRPLNYVLIILESLWRFYWRVQVVLFNWFPKHILYRGKFRGE